MAEKKYPSGPRIAELLARQGTSVKEVKEFAQAAASVSEKTGIPVSQLPGSPVKKDVSGVEFVTTSMELPELRTDWIARKKREDAELYAASDRNEERARAQIAYGETHKPWYSRPMYLGPADDPFRTGVADKERQMNAEAHLWEQRDRQEKTQRIMDDDLRQVQEMTDDERRQLELYIASRDAETYAAMMPGGQDAIQGVPLSQRHAAGLIEKYGLNRVNELAESYSRSQNQQITQQAAQAAQRHANSGVGGAILSNAATLLTAPLGSAGILGVVNEMTHRTGRYDTLDPNNLGNLSNVYTGTVRGQTAQNIEGENPGLMRKALSVGYQAAMSGLDSLVRAAVGGGGWGSLALAGTNSFTSAVSEASSNGASMDKAVLYGLANGGLEIATEKIPLDKLVDAFKGGKQSATKILEQALAGGFAEVTAEELNFLGGILAETAILGENASSKKRITEMVANGLSYEEAKAIIAKENFDEALNTMWVSGLSGTASTGVSAIAGNIAAPKEVQLDGESRALLEKIRQGESSGQPGKAQPAPAGTDTEAAQSQKPSPTVPESAAPTAAEAAAKTADAIPAAASAAPKDFIAQTADQIVSGTLAPQPPQSPNLQEALDMTIPPSPDQKAAPTRQAEETAQPQAEMKTQTEPGTASPDTPGIKGVGGAEANFAGTQAYDLLLSDKNAQRDRQGDIRPVEVPKTDAKGKQVSEFVGNAYGSRLTPDSFIPTIRKMVTNGDLSHDVQSNDKTLAAAATDISRRGIYNSVEYVRDVSSKRKISAEDIGKAELLYAYLAQGGEATAEQTADVFVSLTKMATESGRALQMYRLFRQMTPEGMTMVMQKTLERQVADLQRRGTVSKDYMVNLDPAQLESYTELAKKVREATSEEGKSKAAAELAEMEKTIYASEAAKLPVTFQAKWDAWRYMAMLGNVKTQVRNLGGNLALIPYTDAKRILNSFAQKILIKKSDRTVAVLPDFALMKWAAEDAKTDIMRDVLSGSVKLGDGSHPKIMDDVRVFETGFLEAIRKATNTAVEVGDMIFKSREYVASMSGFLKARGYTAQDVRSGKVDAKTLNEGRAFAVQEAMRATFNDTNALSDALSDMRFSNPDNAAKKVLNYLGEGVLPFRKTPANIVVRFTEYSPVGIAKGLWNAAFNIRSGKISAAAAIDQLSAGLTGTAAMALGFGLAKGMLGFRLTGSNTDDNEKRQGRQDYALEFTMNGETYSYTIDWASPSNLPLFVGANLYELAQNENPDVSLSDFTRYIYAAQNALEPMLSLSCLSSLNNLIESARYTEEGTAAYAVLANVATSYLTQGIPSLLRQGYHASSENKRQTFSNSEDPAIRGVQKTLGNIPFLNEEAGVRTDYIDQWGRTQEGSSVADAFVSPGTLKKIQQTDVDKEISRLKDAGFDATPPTVGKKTSYTTISGERVDRRLTEAEYTTLRTVQGQTAAKVADGIIKTDGYADLSDQQKNDALNLAYEYAQEIAKQAAFPNYYSSASAWIRDAGEDPSQAIVLKVKRDTLNSAITKTFSDAKNGFGRNAAANDQAVIDSYDVYAASDDKTRKAILEDTNGDTMRYILSRDAKASHETTMRVMSDVKKLDSTGKYKWYEQIAASAGNDLVAADAIMKAYMPDFDPDSASPDRTELKYDALRKHGRLPSDYALIYNVQKGISGKASKSRKIAAIQAALDCSEEEAEMYYTLYNDYQEYEEKYGA